MTSPRAGADPWLSIIRIALGLWFIKAAFIKVGLVWYGGFLPFLGANERFSGFQAKRVAEWVQTPEIWGWYRGFLEHAVLPNAQAFAHLQAVGETVVGLGLLLGLFTPVSGGLALFLTLNYALATWYVGFCQQGFHFLLVVCLLAAMFGQGANRFGIDGWRKGPRPAVTFA